MTRLLRTTAFGVLALALCVSAGAEWNVRGHGAMGDGVADDTEAFQKALDAAQVAGGGVVNVPAGTYCIKGVLRIPGAVTLQGTFRTPAVPFAGVSGSMPGSALHAYAGRGDAESEPFIRLAGHTATLAGMVIAYPEWSQDDVPPAPYPPTVRGDHVEDVAVLDCLILNAYEALHFENSARMIIRNIFGYPSFRGLYIDACYDISRVENCHFWPFGVHYKHDDPYCKWVNVNGVAFEFARTDWQYVTHTFCFGYGVGYRFSKSKNGPCNGSFVGIGADSCRRAVYVEDAQPPGLLITNGEFVGRWGSQDSVGVEIGPECGSGKVNLANCAFWGPLERCLISGSAQAQLSVTNSNFCSWDVNGTGVPAVHLAAGKAILQGNTFDDGRLHVRVEKDVRSAILLGNQAGGGFRYESDAGKRVQAVANEESGITWTDEAKMNYRIDVGTPGDAIYLMGIHGPEAAGEWADGGTKRWTHGEMLLDLPVIPGKAYEVTLDIHTPEYAVSEENALYLGDTKLVSVATKGGPSEAVARFTPEKDQAKLFLRVKAWRPIDTMATADARSIGVGLRSVHVRAVDAPKDAPLFDANTGETCK